MGLSSSQARLLSLTGRMHDIEYKAQHLEAQKLQMANESAHVYKEYENALSKTKIQVKQMYADGSSNNGKVIQAKSYDGYSYLPICGIYKCKRKGYTENNAVIGNAVIGNAVVGGD